jgi:hypothetical protein
VLTGRKYLLDLSAEQEAFAERIGGACRAVWNTALEQRREYRRRGAFIGYHENILTAGRAEPAPPRPGARVGARKPRNRVGRKANRQATAAQATAHAAPKPAGIPGFNRGSTST